MSDGNVSVGTIVLAVVTTLPATLTAIGAWVQSASNGAQLVALKSALLEQMIMHAENGNDCRGCHKPEGTPGKVMAPPTPPIDAATSAHPVVRALRPSRSE